MTTRVLVLVLFTALTAATAGPVSAAPPQPLPHANAWTDTAAIATHDDWSAISGVIGYRGDDLTTAEAADPQTVVTDGSGTPVDVIANRTNPAAVFAGGVAEFELADPVVALRGSATADTPHLVLSLDTRGLGAIRASYVLRDLDARTNDAMQPFALQYRVGGTGDYENVPSAFVPDATAAPTDPLRSTRVDVALPSAATDQPLLELRILTANAAGADEWVGVDDIAVSGETLPPRDSTPPALAVAMSPTQKLARALRRGVAAAVSVDEPAQVRTALWISRRLAHRLRIPRRIGTATTSVDAGTTPVTTRIAATARRKLVRLERFRVTLCVRASDAAGNAAAARAATVLAR